MLVQQLYKLFEILVQHDTSIDEIRGEYFLKLPLVRHRADLSPLYVAGLSPHYQAF